MQTNSARWSRLTSALRRLAARAGAAWAFLWRKPRFRLALLLAALAAIAFNGAFFHIAAMPDGILQPATDEHFIIDPAYNVYLNGELPPLSYTYGPVLPLLLGYTSVMVTLVRVAVTGLPIQTLAGVDKTELVFYGRLWNAGIMALTSLLVYWIVVQATRRRLIGLCVALIFSFGSYVVRLAKPDATAGLFALAAVAAAAAYLADYRFRPARLSLAAATVLMVLAFFTKYTAVEFMVILPFAAAVKAWRERRAQPAWVRALGRDLLIVAGVGLASALLIGQISFLKNPEHYQAFTTSLTVQAATAYRWTQEGRTAWTNWLRLDFWRQRLNIYAVSTTGSVTFAFLCVAATVRYLFSRRPALQILAAGTFFTLVRALGRTVRVSDVELIAAGLVILGAVFIFELGGWLARLWAAAARRRPAARDAWRLAPPGGAVFSGVLAALICLSAIRTQDPPRFAISRAISQALEACPGLTPGQVWFGLYDERDFSPAWMKGAHFYATYGTDAIEAMLAQAAPLGNSVLVLRPLDPDPRVNLLALAATHVWLAQSYTVLEFGDLSCAPHLTSQQVVAMSSAHIGRVFSQLGAISLAYKHALYTLLPAGARPDYQPRIDVIEARTVAAASYDSLAASLKNAAAAADKYANTLGVLQSYYAAHAAEDSPQVKLIEPYRASELAVAAAGNVVANPSFEQSGPDGAGAQFDGWTNATFWNPAQAQGVIGAASGFNSSQALELDMTGAAGAPERIGVQQDCGSFAAGTALVLQADINLPADLVNAAAQVGVVLYDPDAIQNYSVLNITRSTTTNGWHTSTALGKAPAKTGQYQCMLVAQIAANGPVAGQPNVAQIDNILLRAAAPSP